MTNHEINFNFATQARKAQLLEFTLAYLDEHYNGYDLYDWLAGAIGLGDEEIIRAGFTDLEEFTEGLPF